MASLIYNRFKANLMNKEVDLEADTIKVALMKTAHSASTVADNVWTDVSANELDSGSGYTTGGATLAGKGVTQAATTKFDATDASWTSATFTAYYAVIYDTTATSNLICSIDFGGAKAVSSGTFTVQFNSSGIITLA
jgi:hypothetical protein